MNTDLLPVPGEFADESHFGYFLTMLRVDWGSLTAREAKAFKKKYPLMASAIEGVLKYDRR